MSTRKLIIAALVCGLAILVAFTVQVLSAARDRGSSPPAAVTTTAGVPSGGN